MLQKTANAFPINHSASNRLYNFFANNMQWLVKIFEYLNQEISS